MNSFGYDKINSRWNINSIITGFILCIPLFVYIKGMCPTVFVGDAGDFLTASFSLGVPHPPGYPLYTLLGHLFMKLPIPGGLSSPAFRMNFMSTVSAWLTVIFLYLYLKRIFHSVWPALAGSMVFAFSRQFWIHAEITEVYTMQVMFMTLIFYLSVLYVEEKKTGFALLLAFVMGLALSHQYAILIFYPGVLIYIGINGGLRMKAGTWILAVILAISGLLPYLYLPAVEYKTPDGKVIFQSELTENETLPDGYVLSDETPFDYFWDYFSRRNYTKTRIYTHSEEALPEKTTTSDVFKRFVEVTREDFGIPLIFFGLLGWLALVLSLFKPLKSEKNIGHLKAPLLPPAMGYVLYFLVVHFYPSGDILGAPLENIRVVVPPLLIPMQVGLATIIAFGIEMVSHWSKDTYKNPAITRITLTIIVVALICINFNYNHWYCDKSQSVSSHYFAQNVLASCEADSILVTTGDETYLFWYLQTCAPSVIEDDPLPGYRRDVRVVNWRTQVTDLSILSNEADAMKTVVENMIYNNGYYFPDGSCFYGTRPINSTFIPESFASSNLIMNTNIILFGMTYWFWTSDDERLRIDSNLLGPANLSSSTIGAEPLLVIDRYLPSAFSFYTWDGFHDFKQPHDLAEIINSEGAIHYDDQEEEILSRVQEAFYRYGIQARLDTGDNSRERARTSFLACVSVNPGKIYGWKELGDSYVALNDYDNGRIAYQRVFDLVDHGVSISDLKLAETMTAMAYLELQCRNFTDAATWARSALELNPDDSYAARMVDDLANAGFL